jgi:hypothetical protein
LRRAQAQSFDPTTPITLQHVRRDPDCRGITNGNNDQHGVIDWTS